MICALFSFILWLMFSLLELGIALMLRLGLVVLELMVRIAFWVGELIVCGLTGTASACVSTAAVASKPVKNSPAKLSRHDRKAIEKNIRRAKSELETDLMMYAEVFADD